MFVLILVAFLATCLCSYFWLMSGKPKIRKDGNDRIVSSLASTPYFFFLAVKKSMFHKKSKNIVLPNISFTKSDISIDGDHVRKYRKVCGFSSDDNEVPLTYPYLIIFPLQGLLLVDPSFPFPAMGVVHLANRIQQFGQITTANKYTATVKMDPKLLPHAKGYCFVVVSEVYSSSKELLWRCESTYLYRTKVTGGSAADVYESRIKNEDAEGCEELKPVKLPTGFGLKYAAVSGDFNPIHLYAITAKLFGFPKGAIIHGMWSNGACVAEIMPPLHSLGAATPSKEPIADVYIEFKMPMYLPANATLECKKGGEVAGCTASGNKNKRVFQILMKNKKNSELVPHLRGTCSWK